MIKKVLLFLIFIYSSEIYSAVKSDTFIIHSGFDNFTVLSPTKYNKTMSVIIYNDTLVKMYGRLENQKKDQVTYVSILPQTQKAIDIKIKKGQVFFFFPISPPFQKMVLSIGQSYYEIPEKK